MRSARRIIPLRSLAAACALSGSAFLLTACSNSDTTASDAAVAAQTSPGLTSPPTASPSPSPSPSPSLNREQAERKDLLSQAKVTWEQATDTAVGEVPDGKLVALELGRAHREATASPDTPSPASSPGAPEWEAMVAAADGTVHRIDIDAVSGEVLRSEAEADQGEDDKREVTDRLNRAEQTPEQAVRTATDKVKGTVTGLELDENDDQQLVWSVDVVNTEDWNKTTVDVSATDGKIVREQMDRD